MAEEEHVFEASGDPCPLCAALAGQVVPAGYQPHPGCLCRTVKRKDGGECHYTGSGIGTPGPPWTTTEVTVTVLCPDGSSVGYSMPVDTSSATTFAEWLDLVDGAMYEAAEDICDDCPEPSAPDVS